MFDTAMLMKKLTGAAVNIINNISKIAGIIALIFVTAMMLLTVVDIFLRYIFNAPITGSAELTEFFVVIAGFLGLAWCALKGGHMKVDMIINRLPPNYQAITDCITLILSLTVLPLLAWLSFVQANNARLERTASSILRIPVYPFYIIVGIGWCLLLLVMLILLAELIRRTIRR